MAQPPTSPLRTAALDLALSDAVKLQDFFYVALSMHGASAAGRDATWAHFTEKLDAYKAKVGEAGSSIMDASIVGACGGFCTEAAANDIVAFFEAHPLPRNTRKIDQIVESTRASAAYVARARWLLLPIDDRKNRRAYASRIQDDVVVELSGRLCGRRRTALQAWPTSVNAPIKVGGRHLGRLARLLPCVPLRTHRVGFCAP